MVTVWLDPDSRLRQGQLREFDREYEGLVPFPYDDEPAEVGQGEIAMAR